MEAYNKYKNLARKEMGIETALELDTESVFISQVSTNALANKLL